MIPNLITWSNLIAEEDLMSEDPNEFVSFNKDLLTDRLTDTLRTRVAKLLYQISLLTNHNEKYYFVN